MEDGYICYIGRPSYQKNTFFLIEVVDAVHKVHPQQKFKLLGVGFYSPDLARVNKMIEERGLEDVIELLPWLNHRETLQYVKESMFYLTVARYEGLPLAVIEAMSLSKAIVASKVLGNVDCVIDGLNGRLLPLDVNAFKEAICELIDNPIKRDEFGVNSRRMFVEKFLIDNRIDELTSIYLS
jgi:glycosyltransferase involved in cell wall biosynthesis